MKMRGLLLKRRWLFFRVIPAILIFALIFFLLRGPYLSNSIKRVLIPVLESATGERVMTDHAVINLIPFYIQVKSIRVLDKDGDKILWVTKTRAYIDLLALLHGEIRVRRLTLKEPNLTASKEDIQNIVKNLQAYLSSDGEKRFAFSINSIKITDGEFELRDAGRFRSLSGKGLVVNSIVRDALIVDLALKEGRFNIDGLSEQSYKMAGRIKIKKDGDIEVTSLKMDYSGSTVNAHGDIIFSDGNFKEGRLKGDAKVFATTINKLFGVEGKDGVLEFSGSVDILPQDGSELPMFLFDLKTEGFFYLEDLMKIIKVKDRIEGKVTISGNLKGSYPDITGNGVARLEDAIFSTLPMDDVEGEIGYKDRRFTLTNFIAHTYGGELRGNGSLIIPQGDYFIDADVRDIKSTDFLKFIRWDAPFSDGIINGRFNLKKIRGEDFDITADVNYINKNLSDDNPVTRLKGINGRIDFREKVVGIKNMRFFTSLSELFMDGRVDLIDENLSLDLRLRSNDASELLSYIKGNLRFEGRAIGKNDNPEVSGDLRMVSGGIKGIPFDSLNSDITYTIRSLTVKSMNIRKDRARYEVNGSILFKGAERIFSFNEPYFDINALITDGDTRALIRAFYKDMPVTGFVDGRLSFKGNDNQYTGNGSLHIKEANILGEGFDRVDLETSFTEGGFDFPSIVLNKGMSELVGVGGIYPNERFKLNLVSNKLRLEDIGSIKRYNVTGMMDNVKINASGVLSNPMVDFSMTLNDGNLRGILIGDGMIKGMMKDKVIHLSADLFKDNVTIRGNVMLRNGQDSVWNLNMDFKKTDYGSMLKGLLKDIPEDISLNLEGDMRLSGEGDKVSSMKTRFNLLSLSLYDYNLTNRGDIILSLNKGRLAIESLSLTGIDSDVSVTGMIDMGRGYDVRLKGRMDMAMLSLFVKKVPSLKGRGDYTIDITGDWKEPDISGEIGVRDVAVSIKDFPYTIGSVNGRLILKKDRVALESVRGSVAGGKVEVSGFGYLDRFSLKRLFLTLEFNGISISHLEGIRAVCDGRLFYDASQKGTIITGNIDIIKARYERRVEWKGWLLGLREKRIESTKQADFLKDASINIHLAGSRDITINNNILNAPIEIDLTITGTIRRYGLIGSVKTVGGSIYFRDNEFEIINGRVDFVGAQEIKPFLNIKAETFTGGYKIRLSLEGPLEKPSLSLFSEPPLSDNDIFTLLAVGRIGKGEKGFESGLATGEATAILTGGIEGLFGEELRGIMGIDRFEINPQTSSTGAVTPKVTVGKRMLNDKLSVSYTTSIGTTEESLIRLRYNINKNISIVGTRDELGSVGGDINYRFEFK